MPHFLGEFKESCDGILFKLKANEPLVPGTVTTRVFRPPNLDEEFLTVIPSPDTDAIVDNEFQTDPCWPTEGRVLTPCAPDSWKVEWKGQDALGHEGVHVAEFRIVSSYGRCYGSDYGHGL